jgi:serpin B
VRRATTIPAAGSTTTTSPPVEIKIDHPFIYLIRDTRTGAIIFIGQVVDPRAAGAASPG